MYRGTTHTFYIVLPDTVPTSELVQLYVTFLQRDMLFRPEHEKVVLEKDIDDVTIEGQRILVSLSQEDTLKFEARKDTLIQLRGLNTNDEAWASNKKSISVKSILKDGVISID